MHTKLLIGPVTPTEAALAPLWELSGNRTFVAGAGVDEALRPSDGWRPEALALFLTRQGVPPAVWAAPLPVIGLATNWGRSFHAFREFARLCDRVLIGPDGVEHARRLGLSDVRAADLDALPLAAFGATPNSDCEYDILLACEEPGTFDAAWREALAIVLGLAERWNVLILPPRSPVWEQAARRSRLVLVACPPGGDRRPALTAVASGALVFCWPSQPGGTQLGAASEAFDGALPERVARLNIFLRDEKARRDRVESALAQAREHCAERAWRAILGIDRHEEAHVTRVASRGARVAEDTLAGRLWFWLGEGGDSLVLSADIAAALVRCPESAALHNALGLTVEGRTADEVSRTAGNAVRHFRRAFELDGGHAMAGLNLAEALLAAGQSQEARDLTESLLATMSTMPSLPASVMAAGHFPAGEQPFHGLWERAAATHPDSPDTETKAKRALMAARLHTLAAALTDDLLHHYEAVIACPDLIPARAALGCALARAGQIADGIPHLWAATEGNPFDAAAARLLDRALEATGDHVGRRRLAYRQRLLARSAPSLLSHEPWFDNAPPLGDELTSIIIPCCDQVEYTRQCITSLVQHTRQPYELILVDNGSTDETPAYFAEVRKLLGPDRVRIIRNESNLGFAKACNQGLATADGLYLILLNNDVILTNGWLEGLIRWSLIDWPRVGIVGPVTNHASPPQEIPVEYASLDELEVFAAKRRWEYAGTCLEFPRLIGFCLLIRRDVLSAIGSLDERYGIGFFEDDDLCLRANDAGYRLLIALDTFVHHFGSRTFTGLGINASQQLRTNFAKFQDKWGGERTVGYRLPKDDSARTHAVQASKHLADVPAPTVSLCLIVRDEEANLPDCLESVRGLFAEVVVVDTGSTDRTRRIAAEFGAKVVDFPWVDDFALARNESLSHATGRWVFWMDADDRLDEANRERLRSLIANLPDANVAYAMKCECVGDSVGGGRTVVDHVRLFRNRPDVHWEYRIHEQILPSLRRSGAEVLWSDVVIRHMGYANAAVRTRKRERDQRLLSLENAERPDDPFTLFNMASVACEREQHAEAIPLLRRSLERSHPGDSIVRKLYALLAQSLRRVDRLSEALRTCADGLRVCPDDTELLFLDGQFRLDAGDPVGAAASLQRLLTGPTGQHFASLDAGLRGHKGRHALAVAYYRQGRATDAEREWLLALAEAPAFIPARLGLAELLLAGGRWDELERVADELGQFPDSRAEALTLLARSHLARKDFKRTRELLNQAVVCDPEAVWPLVILSHALLQEGNDGAEAEQVLRRILAREPNNSEARHNLAILLGGQIPPTSGDP